MLNVLNHTTHKRIGVCFPLTLPTDEVVARGCFRARIAMTTLEQIARVSPACTDSALMQATIHEIMAHNSFKHPARFAREGPRRWRLLWSGGRQVRRKYQRWQLLTPLIPVRQSVGTHSKRFDSLLLDRSFLCSFAATFFSKEIPLSPPFFPSLCVTHPHSLASSSLADATKQRRKREKTFALRALPQSYARTSLKIYVI